MTSQWQPPVFSRQTGSISLTGGCAHREQTEHSMNLDFAANDYRLAGKLPVTGMR